MAKECVHEQLHYMGKGPLPDTNPDCRWNYVCRKCRRWIKYKRPIKLDADDRHGKLPEEDYISEPSPGLGFNVPKPSPAPKKAAKPKRKAKAKRPAKRKRAKAHK